MHLIRFWKVFVPTPSKGARLAIDVGTVRIGIARCDSNQILAFPVDTITNDSTAMSKIAELVSTNSVELIYVGNPISLNTSNTKSTLVAQDFAKLLLTKVSVPVHLVDERLTTVSAQNQLQNAGRSPKSSRSVIDQVAAVVLLDHALAIEKSTGRLAGVTVVEQVSD